MAKRRLSKETIREKPMVRCLECFDRVEVPLKATEMKCPNCGTKYLIYWPAPDIAKIKGIIA